MFMHDDVSGDMVLACGGWLSGEDAGTNGAEGVDCYCWGPETAGWEAQAPLNGNRFEEMTA